MENASSWSLKELFTILIGYGLIQPISQVKLNALVGMFDDSLVCLCHSNMKRHTLGNCWDFQKKVKELQRIGSLKFVSAHGSEKFISLMIGEHFTKETPYIL